MVLNVCEMYTCLRSDSYLLSLDLDAQLPPDVIDTITKARAQTTP